MATICTMVDRLEAPNVSMLSTWRSWQKVKRLVAQAVPLLQQQQAIAASSRSAVARARLRAGWERGRASRKRSSNSGMVSMLGMLDGQRQQQQVERAVEQLL